jgi:hypothetical protein
MRLALLSMWTAAVVPDDAAVKGRRGVDCAEGAIVNRGSPVAVIMG